MYVGFLVWYVCCSVLCAWANATVIQVHTRFSEDPALRSHPKNIFEKKKNIVQPDENSHLAYCRYVRRSSSPQNTTER